MTAGARAKLGVWKVEHGLSAGPDATKPGRAGKGKYTLKILFTPNDKTGTSKIGFVQVYRQGMPDGGWGQEGRRACDWLWAQAHELAITTGSR